MTRRFTAPLLYTLPLLLAVLVYGYALRLPYFLDDGPHFMILGQTNGLEHWGDFPPFPFYRPLTFTLWKGFGLLTGGYPAFALHMVNVLGFGVAGVLAGQVTRRLAPPRLKRMAAVIAGAAFVLFPFSYQAVAMVAALFHMMLAVGVLLCIWAALMALDGRGGLPMLALSWLGAFVATFSHESGLLLPVLLAGALITAYAGASRPPWRKAAAVMLPAVGLAALYLLLWLSFSPNEEARSLSADVHASLATLGQGLAYPFVTLARPFVDGDAAPIPLLVGIIGVALAALLTYLWITPHGSRTPRASLPPLYGLAWYAAALMPAVLFLDAGYVLGQTRLGLLASAGGAAFWGLVIAALWRHGRLAGRVAAATLIVLGGGVSADFLGARRADFLRLADWNAAAVEQFTANDVLSTGALIVNAPAYVAPVESDRRFLLGTEGVLWTDPSLDYSQQFWMNSGQEIRDVATVTHPATLNADGIRYSTQPPTLAGDPLYERLRDAAQVYVTRFDGADFTPAQVKDAAPPALPSADVRFAQAGITLRAARLDYDAEANAAIVRLRWRSTDTPAGEVRSFVHVYCDDTFIAQRDGGIWGNTYPFNAWQPGETHTERRTVYLPDDALQDASAACLNLRVGVYDAASGERFTARDANGQRLPEDSFHTPINGP